MSDICKVGGLARANPVKGSEITMARRLTADHAADR